MAVVALCMLVLGLEIGWLALWPLSGALSHSALFNAAFLADHPFTASLYAFTLDLARHGCRVTMLERADAPGGKIRQVEADGRQIDAGPTVFTMRWVFDALFADAGARLDDLFADLQRSADAIGAFAGAADARGFLSFAREAKRTYETLEVPFIKGPLPTMVSLARDVRSLRDLVAIRPFQSLWTALGQHMRDPRLRQLFARYATYCGSSPFLAPATLMLVAHVEQQGVWFVAGGMHRVAMALAGLATSLGAVIRYDAEVAALITVGGRASGLRLASGEAARRRRRHERRPGRARRRPVRTRRRCRGARRPRFGALALGAYLDRARRGRRLPPASPHGVLLRRLPGRVRRPRQPQVGRRADRLCLRAGPRRYRRAAIGSGAAAASRQRTRHR
ncbi:MAG: hypothetical protein NVS2B11_10890 [Acetobacteraceae bacterium]